MHQPKVLLITPYAMAERLDEVLHQVHNWGEVGNTIRKKRVLVNGETIKKHFNNLPENALPALVEEWSGVETFVMLLETVPERAQDDLTDLAYISPDNEKALRDAKLWFPELFI